MMTTKIVLSNNYNTYDELYHYGVKGMKWGVRRYGLISKGENRRIGKQTYKETYKQSRESGNGRIASKRAADQAKMKVMNDNRAQNRKIIKEGAKNTAKKAAKKFDDYNTKYEQERKEQLTKAFNVGKNAINNYKAKKSPQREDISQLSDKELRARINRLQMEKQYAQLTARETSGGKKFVKDVLTNAAKQTATQYAARYMAKGVDKAIERALAGR